MTVGELRKIMAGVDGGRVVILARDSEGNGHSPLAGVWGGACRAETEWSGEVGLERLTDGDRQAGYGDEDVIRDGKPALILTPAN